MAKQPKSPDYAEAARAMIAVAERGDPALPILVRRCPNIYRQLEATKECPRLLSMWGRCYNFDENARAEIVHPAILQAIGEAADVAMRGRVVHAGLQHTYGYLFSLLETPFGYKRDRWVQPTLDQALGFTTATLRDMPAAGTLLGNLTWFLGRIAFGGRERESRDLDCTVASKVREYPFERLRGRRIVEEIILATRRHISVHTDLIDFPYAVNDPDSDTLLIYSAITSAGGKLLTAFPTSARLFADGDTDAFRLRYNAYVRGLTPASGATLSRQVYQKEFVNGRFAG